MRRRLFAGSTALLCAIGLLGCVSDPPVSMAEATAVAAEAADAVERQIAVRPSVDCGDESVGIADGAVIDCTITDPADGLTYEARIRIINFDGSDDFTVDVAVADEPNERERQEER